MKDLMHIFTTICLAGMMLSLLLFAVAWMCEQRFNLYRKVQAIFHRSFVETFLLLLFCIGLIHVGSTKNAGGTSNDTELSLMTDIAGVQVPIIESLALPVDMPMMITNLSIFAITPAETSVFLSAIWPEGCAIPNSKLSVYALHDLVTNGWEKVAVASLPSDAMKAEIELPHAILPKGCDSKSFFTVGTLHDSDCDGIADSDERLLLNTNPRCDDSDGDSYPDGEELHSGTEPNMADTDGDGLSDGDEAGSISVMPYFEWYQEPAMSSVRSISPLIESYFGASAILQLSYPTTIRGRKCVQVVAFDNGYVALTSPGDFNGWSFPSGPMHLNEHCYNNGSILIAPYWSSQQVTSLVTNSWLKAWNDESRNVAVAEFNNVLCDINKYMTFQVVIPYGTGNVVKVSFKSSDIPLDGTYAVSGFHHKGYEATNGIYNVEWDFARRGEIPVGKTLEYRFGVGTNPLSADSDGDGVRDDVEFALGIKPLNPDTDSDGLNDGMELDIGTNPLSSDTDNDGLLDKWEIDNGLNPKSSESDDGASGDADGDGLSNLEEAVIGSNPANGDTDGDGLNDSQEILYGTDFASPDTDKDGLLDGQEIEMALNPLQPDTDGDGMHDGWESRQDGFDPTVDNSEDDNPDNDADSDPDGDGILNKDECDWDLNPNNSDTDGDGVMDGAEILQNSDPSDSSDGGIPNSRVLVSFTFGDHSGSHSEKYQLTIKPVNGAISRSVPRTYTWINANYGECETKTAALELGFKYEITMRHSATNIKSGGQSTPDYDYTLVPHTNNLPPYVIAEDPEGLFGVDESSSVFAGEGKIASISIHKFTVSEIRFNHDYDSNSFDALNIRKNATTSYDIMHGEWHIQKGVSQNYPVCYSGGSIPSVKVKFKVEPNLPSATFSACSTEVDSPLGGLVEKNVVFSDGESTWVEFNMDSSIERKVRKFDHRWEWRISKLMGNDVEHFVCATTGPHRVYTLLGEPLAPWTKEDMYGQCPWADALEFACSVADGESDKKSALARITSHLFYNMGFRYEIERGAYNYYYQGGFKLSAYLDLQYPVVNCYDQAYGVATLGNLIGVHATTIFTSPFGYINPVNLVGVGVCNNPFCGNSAYPAEPLRPIDDINRSMFGNHRYVFAEGVIFDACAGPELGTKTHTEYLKSVIDTSTMDEMYYSYFSPVSEGVWKLDNGNYKLQ